MLMRNRKRWVGLDFMCDSVSRALEAALHLDKINMRFCVILRNLLLIPYIPLRKFSCF